MHETSFRSLTALERERLLKLASSLNFKRHLSVLPSITLADRGERLPLSFAQQRLWFLAQMKGVSEAYHMGFSLRLEGRLDAVALRRALDRILVRHEVLRTTFALIDGEPVQRIARVDDSRFHLIEHDLREHSDATGELGHLAAEEARASFDLAAGPLIRGRLVRLAEEEHALLITMHHIVSDGWSMGILRNELSALYGAFLRNEDDPLPELKVQYADYAVWQRDQDMRDHLKYWTTALAGYRDPFDLAPDAPRGGFRVGHAGILRRTLPSGLARELGKFSSKRQASVFMVLLSGLALLVYRQTRRADLCIGTTVAGRDHLELEPLIGFFINILPLRISLSDDMTGEQLLMQVRQVVSEGLFHEALPFEHMIAALPEMRQQDGESLLPVIIRHHNYPKADIHQWAGGLQARGLSANVLQTRQAKSDLDLQYYGDANRLLVVVEFDAERFDPERVEELLLQMESLLAGLVKAPDAPLSHLLGPSAGEQARLDKWNDTSKSFADASLIELFAYQVVRRPNALACRDDAQDLSFADLERRSNNLARALMRYGLRRQERVALYLPRSTEFLTALLAVFKAGGVYVPVDPSYPDAYVKRILDDARPAIVLVKNKFDVPIAAKETILLTVDETLLEGDGNPFPNCCTVKTDDLAYIAYTSGSTGQPKGVCVDHGQLLNCLQSLWEQIPFEIDAVMAQKTASMYVVSLKEMLAGLLAGVPQVIFSDLLVKDTSAFAASLERHQVTFLHVVPSHLAVLLEHADRLRSLRHVIAAGEPLSRQLRLKFEQVLPGVRLYNNYGCTEMNDITYCLPGEQNSAGGLVPIGRPIRNIRVHVLDEQLRVLPIGVAGELYVEGAAVGRGYWNQPELSAKRFLANPFRSADRPLFRTGDRVRRLADGRLEFVGREDFQVKIRGQRIELPQVEQALAEHPCIMRSAVMGYASGSEEAELVAYYVATSEDTPNHNELHTWLSGLLPHYMVPSRFVSLDALPLLPNGKLDRKALPAPDGEAYAAHLYEPPQGETETALAAIWAELLKLDRVGRHDNFFALGGHSLLAMRVVTRLRQSLNMEVPIADLFAQPVLADLARRLENAAHAVLPPITLADRGERLPLSFAQQRLWFLAQMKGVSEAYHMGFSLRLEGRLDAVALRRALDRILVRHEVLRTTFALIDGEPVQRIARVDDSRFHLIEHDLREHSDATGELGHLAAEEARASFDLAAGPLIRGRLVRLAEEEHALLITMHHIVSDGWSMGILRNELSALYGAFLRNEDDPLPELKVQYADYAVWQRKWIEGEILRQQAEYWKTTLAGVPELLELPAHHPRPAQQDYAGSFIRLELDETLTAGLKALSRKHGTTLHMTLLAGWAALLARLSGQQDVVIGTPVANRSRMEIENLIGFFVNTLALRLDVSGSPTVTELLDRVKTRALAAQQHQDIPFEQVVEIMRPARSLAHSPLFQVGFAWQNTPEGSLTLPALKVRHLRSAASRVTTKFDLTLSLYEVGQKIFGGLEYATALFEPSAIERYLGYFRALLQAMVADDTQAVDRLPMLSDPERHRVLYEWNDTRTDFPAEKCIHELFQMQVERTPEAVALVFENESLSYAELNTRANRLAHYLRELGVRPDVRVAICVERGFEMIIALMAVLKAGGAYVPLDPAYPTERLRFMLEDSEAAVLLTQGHLEDISAGINGSLPILDLAQTAEWEDQPAANPDPAAAGLTSHHLAYVIYTSGSTGTPKGVMVEHRNAVNFLSWAQSSFASDVLESTAFSTSLNFDLAVYECLVPLAAGTTVSVVPNLLALTRRQVNVTLLNTVPSAMNALLEEDGIAPTVRVVNLAGEPLGRALVEHIFAATEVGTICNLYGPSETTTYSTWMAMRRGDPFARHIGKPIANTQVYILDEYRQPVPVGVGGELYIGGAGVARGYLNHPELTAERFLADPFASEPDARMYKTGDLGRWLPDGNIEFLGRNDFQVKIRGFRIELGEIEARLMEHPGVREAVVITREDIPGDKRLVAYYTTTDASEQVKTILGAEQLRAHLSAILPEYMVPAAYVGLESLPLTPNGKLDRKALPAPDGEAHAAHLYEPPQGETETALAAIWAELLKLDRVGRHDNFFELGGHSLLAVRVVTRLRQSLNMEVPIADLFAQPVLADLARRLESAAHAVLPPITLADRGERLPLSFAQQRLWFLAQMKGVSEAYHMGFSLRLEGRLDAVALRRALDRILVRHEVLRTTFALIDGELVQRIARVDDSRFHLIEHDLREHSDATGELGHLAAEEARASFDLAAGPLIRGRLVRLAEEEHALLITMHHIVSDGWSMGILRNELSALYGAFLRNEDDPLPELKVQYADYAVWQRKWIEGEILRQQAEYWKTTLAGVPELLELPAHHPRPAQQDYAGSFIRLELDETLTAGLKALSRKHGTTLHMTLLAGWAALLARLSGQQDVVIGTPVANRSRMEIENLIGFFVNTLALRLDVSGSPTVTELLDRVKTRALAAQQHQDIPFEQVVEIMRPARSLAHSPLFQVGFAWQNTPEGSLTLPALKVRYLRSAASRVTTKFDLTLSLYEVGQKIFGGLEYATALFEPSAIERYLGYFRALLQAMVADDTQAVDRLPMLSDPERHRVLYEWNDTRTDFPAEKCIHELFQMQVERTPEAVALVFENESLSYAELNTRANRLAHYLRELGVRPDVRVAICVERGFEMIIALMAVLKAGGAYVPLDPAYPTERLRFMLEDSEAAVLLTQGHLEDISAGINGSLPILDLAQTAEWEDQPAANPDPAAAGLTSHHLAYVIYTSGSTGTPKGVMVEHRNAVNFLSWAQSSFASDVLESTAFSTSLNFDLAVYECLVPLAAGTTVSVVPNLLALTRRQVNVTLLNTVPSAMNALLEEDGIAPTVRVVNLAGEPLGRALVEHIFAATEVGTICNLYGPSETTTYSTWMAMRRGDPFARHIGKPIANTQVYILDEYRQPVPVGVGGELYIGGAGVARGYLNHPELTAERFLADPFASEPDARMYKTGDLGRWLPDGNIEFLGRNDFQVKIRGFRIELGEIEARLMEHPGVREAVVITREDIPGDKRLVAYYTTTDASEQVKTILGAEQLRAHLSAILPEYMVPAAYVGLESLPLTPNGKLDRKALPAPDGEAHAAHLYEPPQGETETALAAIWAELLKLDRVGRHDNFFELGGHSLLAVRVVTRLRQSLNMEVPIADLFAQPVLADLARRLESAAHAVLPPITLADRGERLPLSFAQQRLWFLAQMKGVSEAYHMGFSLRLEGRLDAVALRRALDRILVRHEVLRTTFALIDGEPVQRIARVDDSRFHLIEHDLREHSDATGELGHLAAEEARASFDLAAGPLIRGRLVRLAEEEHALLITMHHIVSDGWSMGILRNELSALYGAFLRNEDDPLPELKVQYADYAVWQRKWIEGEILRQQAEYWKTTLAGVPELLELPAHHPRPAQQDYAGSFIRLELDETLTAGLKALSRKHGTTLHMTLLAGWAALLARLSGQQDVVIGTPVANRSRMEIENLIGFFVNTLALRLDVSGSPTVTELLDRVKTRALAAQQHQDIPFEQVVEIMRPARSLAHSPLFQVGFAWQNTPEGSLTLPALKVRHLRSAASRVTTKFDLTLSLYEVGQKIFGGLEYATALFEPSAIERYLGYFRALLQAMVADDTQAVDRLPMLSDPERHRVLYEWNDTRTDFPAEKCIHELFQMQVERTPEAVALVFENESLSYAELNTRANRLAHYLRELGVRPDVRVAICVERGFEMIIALMAVLKAGGAYVPLDPAYPTERLRFMLEDSEAAVLLTQGHLEDISAGINGSLPILDLAQTAEWEDQPAANPDPAAAGLTSHHLAYVIYTSGSTGTPKGVMVEHRSLVNYIAAISERIDLSKCVSFGLLSTFATDLGNTALFPSLLRGGVLQIFNREDSLEPRRFASYSRRYRLDCIKISPSHLQAVLARQNGYDDVSLGQCIVLGGETLATELVKRVHSIRPNCCIYNHYGPAECTVGVISGQVNNQTSYSTKGIIPLGKPIANTQVYILDEYRQPVPVEVGGELYIGGAGVARGYLNRPELTAERFLADPFASEPDARMYKTGDLGRWLPDGNIEFLGRNDFQVKIRGFRIELGEIEARLMEHPGVREAVVITREDIPGDKRLVAYYTTTDASEQVKTILGAEQLRAHLSAILPEYMVPAAYVGLESLPLTPNGKLDRKALPAPDGEAYAAHLYEPPQGETETALAAIWAELLKLDRVGRHDNFFALGGHSLLAMRVVTRLRQSLNMEVPIADLFAQPVLADLARRLENAAHAVLPPITLADRGERLPLSFAQQRLWFLAQMKGVSEAYHMGFSLRLEGRLDAVALRRALDRILVRHEVLRTTFALIDGEPVQRIARVDDSRFHLIEHDLREHSDATGELGHLAAEEARASFDLAAGPLIRGRLVRLAEEEHALLITMHHIVSDGWSMGILRNELSALYGAFLRNEDDPLPELKVQYADYAVWQRKWIEGEILRQQAEYWKTTLAGVPELLELPAHHPRPAQQDYAGSFIRLELDETLTAGLKALSRKHGTTLHMTLLAGWAALLARLSGQQDVVIGTPVANRSRMEIENLIGFFVNTLALRLDVSGSPTVTELLDRVKTRALAAQQHQDIPFEQVVEIMRPARSLAHSPLFQVGFAWQNTPEGSLTLPALKVRYLRSAASRVTTKFDLTLSLYEVGQKIFGGLEYATALFEPPAIERYLGYFRALLQAMVADDTQAVDRLPMLSDPERHRVLYEWNDTRTDFPAEKCIHELFQMQVERTPEAVALVFENESLSYAELNTRANRLAHYLRELGVRPDVRVAICVERGFEMIIALMAVLKAGGAYVPLDPAYPTERLRFMLEDSEAAVLLTQGHLEDISAGINGSLPILDLAQTAEWEDQPAANPDPAAAGLTSHHLAYVIYTSGSTGTPKGVMVEHRSVARLFTATDAWFHFSRSDVWTLFHSYAFDFSVWEIWGALFHGGRLIVVPQSLTRSPEDFYRLLCRVGATILNQTPSAFRQLITAQARSEEIHQLRHVIIGGEALEVATLKPWYEQNQERRTDLINMYGITETTVHVTYRPLERVDSERGGRSPIGCRIPDLKTYILDEYRQPVPVGVGGELYIGGAGVARGYLNRPELTAERFLADPFASEPDARMYKTGDLGRWLPDGNIEFLGRNDFQVKIRGFRIELGEIEARLMEHPGVREAVVITREDIPGDKRLVAYYTTTDASEQVKTILGAEQLRAHLSAILPEYMVPAAYVGLESLPLTPNGKLDRKALPAPDGEAHAAHLYEPPQGETETALAAIWAELLKLDRVGRHDNFFELGGHSLLAVRVVTRLRQSLNMEVPIADLFAQPVLADLARRLESAAHAVLPPITLADRGERLPLSFAQQRLWFLAQMKGVSEAYHMGFSLRLEGRLDAVALRRALDRILVRHEVLRTTFALIDGEPVQRIARVDDSRFHLIEHDLREHSDATGELGHLAAEEARASFDLAAGPLIRGRLVRLAEEEHALLITMHHIVSDGWSMGILRNELSALYGAFLRNEDDPLPELKVQYADYAVWQRKWIEGEILRQQAEYWKTTLAGVPELLELPAHHPRPAQQDYAGSFIRLELDETLTAGLKALSRKHGTTLHMTLLAGWAALLARLSGQQDVVIGTPVANRSRMEIENLIGFFVNTLALRLDVSGSPTVTELLDRVKTRALAAQQHQDIPFEQVVEIMRPARSLAHSPLFQVGFAWQNTPEGSLTLPALKVRHLRSAASRVTTKFDLTLSLYEVGQKIFGGLEYATALFEPSAIERYLGYFRALLQAMVADDTQAVDRLPMLSDPERHRVLYEWNDTRTDFPAEKCIHELFQMQVERTPEAVALVFENESLSYAELNTRANRLAHYLRELGVRPDVRVAICVERGFEMIIALMAVLKAGGAYVPLDPAYPTERLRFMLEDSEAAVLLTQGHLEDISAGINGSLPILDLAQTAEWEDQPAANPDPAAAGLTSHHLAYVIYTSGSTGTPKGVMVEHRSLVNYIAAISERIDLSKCVSFGLLSTFATDLGNTALFPSLLRGGVLQIFNREDSLEPRRFASYSRRYRLDCIKISPSHLQAVLARQNGYDDVSLGQCIVLGGETLATELVKRVHSIRPNCCIYNHYGPAECTVGVISGQVNNQTSYSTKGIIPLGKPIANTQVYILDEYRQPVPVEVGGELYIGGAGVARGYLNRPELTAERFLADPFASEPDARMYKTGDLGRWLPDGNIEFLGRNDFQVKIRGFRIELGEIEARLMEHPGVREAVVITREDIPGDKRLVAYYTTTDASEQVKTILGAEQLRAHLSAILPEYMVPAAYVGLESLPLTPNGKLDRKALPAPDGEAYAAHLYEPPQGETETALAAIWAELLKLDRVGRHDNFFELGGHSLLAVRVVALLGQSGTMISICDIVTYPTVKDLAARIGLAKNWAEYIRKGGAEAPLT